MTFASPHLLSERRRDEKQSLMKMGSRIVDFVSKTLTYASTNHRR